MSPRALPAITIGRVSAPAQPLFEAPVVGAVDVAPSGPSASLLTLVAAPEAVGVASVFSGAVAAAGDTPVATAENSLGSQPAATADDMLLLIKCAMCGAAMPIEDIANHAATCNADSAGPEDPPASALKRA
jgi:hypothetical protein